MKFLTYNFLTSKCIRGVKIGFPLKINIVEKKIENQDFNSEFMSRMLPRLDWPTIRVAAEAVGVAQDLPEELNLENSVANDSELLQKLHHLLLEIDIIEGQLQCPETGRIFPITQGIPNMLLNEDEV